MKFTIATAALLLLLGTTAPTYARQEKGNEGHSDGGHSQTARPAQKQARPEQPQRQAKPATRQQTRTARPAQKQPTQHAARAPQPQTHAVNRSTQRDAGRSQVAVQQARASGGNRGDYAHGRISEARYASNFGSGHSFHVNRGEYDNRRFAYGGYSFGFIDPWPIGWGYSDDVYVVYADGGYYMYDRVHPGLRISVNIL